MDAFLIDLLFAYADARGRVCEKLTLTVAFARIFQAFNFESRYTITSIVYGASIAYRDHRRARKKSRNNVAASLSRMPP